MSRAIVEEEDGAAVGVGKGRRKNKWPNILHLGNQLSASDRSTPHDMLNDPQCRILLVQLVDSRSACLILNHFSVHINGSAEDGFSID